MNFKKLFLILFSVVFITNSMFAAKRRVESTPMGAQPQSAIKAEVPTPNYCRNIIKAFNEDNKNEALRLFDSFYKKIPSTIMNPKHGERMNFKKRLSTLKEDLIKYHKSLFLCLAMCLTNCNLIERNGMSSDYVYSSKNYNKIWVNLHTAKNKNYKIEFEIISAKKSKISITEGANRKEKVVNISGGYEQKNFFKNTSNVLVPSSSDEAILEPLNLSDRLIDDAPAAAASSSSSAAAATTRGPQDADIKERLELIFNAIPKKCRVHLEQYAQFVIYSVVNFMGSFLCYAEFITGEGRADLILRTQRGDDISGCIIELKRDKTAKKAIAQVRTRKYVNTFDVDVPVVGISVNGLDRKTVTVDCKSSILSPEAADISTDDTLLTITQFVPLIKNKGSKMGPPPTKKVNKGLVLKESEIS